MKKRLLNLPINHSYFLFGARGTGKSTLIKHVYSKKEHLFIDLLNKKTEQDYLRDPERLKAEVLALPVTTEYIVIDEVQKIPGLLDVVHSLIEETTKKFILTGSSARKLKRGHANLLAGRALVRNLFPFSIFEVSDEIHLKSIINFGLLPKVIQEKTNEEKADYLRAYTHTYLKEEVWSEHLIRKLEPFHYFLEVAAQANGSIINIAKIAREVGVDDKSVNQYFSILEDTLIGFYLPAFKHSFRKRLSVQPKFYFFDLGVVRALNRTIAVPLNKKTYEYGNYFEHCVILECYKLIQYFYPDYRLSYLRTHDGLEIDLVVERPGLPLLMIEIKSSSEPKQEHIIHLRTLKKEFGDKVECVCFMEVDRAMLMGDIMIYPWVEGLKKYFVI